MRPRPDAAENVAFPSDQPSAPCASMRPRPDAAENPNHGGSYDSQKHASMRPRPDAAENMEETLEQILPLLQLQ